MTLPFGFPISTLPSYKYSQHSIKSTLFFKTLVKEILLTMARIPTLCSLPHKPISLTFFFCSFPVSRLSYCAGLAFHHTRVVTLPLNILHPGCSLCLEYSFPYIHKSDSLMPFKSLSQGYTDHSL